MSPALAGGFLTTAPPGKSPKQIINLFCVFALFRKKKDTIDPLLFKYKVQPTKKELYECAIVKATQIR